jgi:hypothetical protein
MRLAEVPDHGVAGPSPEGLDVLDAEAQKGAQAEEDDDARELTNAAADEDEGVHARGGDDGNLEKRTN